MTTFINLDGIAYGSYWPISSYLLMGALTLLCLYFIAFFSCDQAALWMVQSVRLSVCYTFLTLFPHRITTKFSGVITYDRSNVHAKGHRLKVKVTEVTTQLNRFRTVTPVWIDIWWWNDAYSLMLLGREALLFPDCNSSLNSPMDTKWCTKLEVA